MRALFVFFLALPPVLVGCGSYDQMDIEPALVPAAPAMVQNVAYTTNVIVTPAAPPPASPVSLASPAPSSPPPPPMPSSSPSDCSRFDADCVETACWRGDGPSCEARGDGYRDAHDNHAFIFYRLAYSAYQVGCTRGSRASCADGMRMTKREYGIHTFETGAFPETRDAPLDAKWSSAASVFTNGASVITVNGNLTVNGNVYINADRSR